MNSDQGAVIVGYDGSPTATAAESWALVEARSRNVPLRLVYAYSGARAYAQLSEYAFLTPDDSTALRTAAEGVLAKAATRLANVDKAVDISTYAYDGDAAMVLLEQARHASTVVLGSRRLGALSAAVVGSVGTAVSARAACPVVVVRSSTDHVAGDPVVVLGVQVDAEGEGAIGYAFDYASRHALRLDAVLCWHPDLLADASRRPEQTKRAESELSEALAGRREKYPDVDVHAIVRQAHAIDGLVAASHGQRLLVVGTHGRGAIAGLLLGSVSQGVLHHATCPVAVVPAATTGGSTYGPTTRAAASLQATLPGASRDLRDVVPYGRSAPRNRLGVMTQTQHRTDTDLKAAIVAELEWTPIVNSTNIGVSVHHGAVTLSGEVESLPERRVAEQAVMRMHGVTAIVEEIAVRGNWGSTNDVDIARDAGYAISHATNVPEDAVKVAVHDHHITLSGEVGWHFQREAALNAVRYLRGVEGVVNAILIKPTVSTGNLKNSISAALMRNAQIEGEHLTVAADTAGAVTLEGRVGTWVERIQAEHLAWSAPGVTAVDNRPKFRI